MKQWQNNFNNGNTAGFDNTCNKALNEFGKLAFKNVKLYLG
jgi:hypothetical protein